MAVEWHVSSYYLLYSPEGRAKWFMYPPPYNGAYATPWLWVDGRQRGYNYNLWASYVAAQVGVPTPVQITLSGDYDPGTRQGRIKALIQNDSTQELTMRVLLVITEDSIYYSAPNGDLWHNHVCRDYIPNQYGTVLTIGAGAQDSVEHPFTIANDWNEQKCKVVVYAQSTAMVPADSSYPAYQGAEVAVLDLVGITEPKPADPHSPQIQVTPNPSSGRPVFALTAGPRSQFHLSIHTVDGRAVSEISGTFNYNFIFTIPAPLPPGVYFYQILIDHTTRSGKLIVAE